MPEMTTRREWLAGTARGAAVAGLAGLPWARTTRAAAGSNERVNLGLIGCGRRGRQLLDAVLALPDVAVTAVCDVDVNKAAAAARVVTQASGTTPATATDYRNLLETQDLAGVLIATPDHWHSIILLSACGASVDAYVEMPLSLTIAEGQAMVYFARKHRRVVQVGLQYRSSPVFEDATRQARAGVTGRVSQTRSWSFTRTQPVPRQPDSEPPDGLDYERWLGPAPLRLYNPARLANPQQWWDYGGGEAVLWNSHLQDLVHSAMRTTTPMSATAVGSNLGLADFRETPDTLEVLFEYQGVQGRFMHVYSLRLNNDHAAWGRGAARGVVAKADPAAAIALPSAAGLQIHGDRGTLCVDGQGVVFLPAGDGDVAETRPAAGPAGLNEGAALTRDHIGNFIECVRTRAEPRAIIEAGHIAALPGLVANIAYRLGRKLHFEPAKQEFYLEPEFKTLDAEANALRNPVFRPPYGFPNA